MDDDDEWLPEKLEKQLALLSARDTSCALIGCGLFTVDDKTGARLERKPWPARGMVFDRLILANFIGSTSFPLIRRRCLEECGPFDVLMKSTQDYEMWLRIAARFSVDCVDEPLALYHVGGDARISTNALNRIQGLERLDRIHAPYLTAHPKAKAARLLKRLPHYIGTGAREKARRAFFEAVRLMPFAFRDNLVALRMMIRCQKRAGE